jgi:putative redox protein
MMGDGQRAEVRLIEGARMVAKVGKHEFAIDFPEKLGGQDTAPTPTQLLLTSIAACKLFYAYRFLLRRDVETDGSVATVSWKSSKTAVEHADVQVQIAGGLDPDLEKSARAMMDKCFVAKSVIDGIEVEYTIE